MTTADDQFQVIATMNRYAEALDRRDWALLDNVFTEDVTADYGGEVTCTGRTELVAMIRSFLGGCGPTQHLLGNFDASVDGNRARLTCKLRAFHIGRAEQFALAYEVLGFYHSVHDRTPNGWRIAEINEETTLELGTRDILGPEQHVRPEPDTVTLWRTPKGGLDAQVLDRRQLQRRR